MRHNSNSNRRQRGRGNSGARRGGGGQPRTQVYDSNGPEVRIRGTANQVHEKYLALAKDATSSGDYVLAESYMQHAEHYQRVINSWEQDAVPADKQAENVQKAQDDKPQHNNKPDNKPQNKQAPKKNNSNDDLALPASILGDAVEASSKESEAENA